MSKAKRTAAGEPPVTAEDNLPVNVGHGCRATGCPLGAIRFELGTTKVVRQYCFKHLWQHDEPDAIRVRDELITALQQAPDPTISQGCLDALEFKDVVFPAKTKFIQTSLKSVRFLRCKLPSAEFSPSKELFSGQLSSFPLDGVTFDDTVLENAVFDTGDFENVSFINQDLGSVRFNGAIRTLRCKFHSVKFIDSHLGSWAQCDRTVLNDLDFSGARLDSLTIRGACSWRSVNLGKTYLSPDGFSVGEDAVLQIEDEACMLPQTFRNRLTDDLPELAEKLQFSKFPIDKLDELRVTLRRYRAYRIASTFSWVTRALLFASLAGLIASCLARASFPELSGPLTALALLVAFVIGLAPLGRQALP